MLALALSGCARGAVEVTDRVGAHGPVVVCSLFAPYDFARAIAKGTGADVQMLMNPGVDSHSFDPTPTDMTRIERADLFVYVGGENEAWVEKVLASSAGDGKALRLMDAVYALDEEIVPGMQAQPEPDAAPDEHIWTSPLNAMQMAQAIADALIEVDAASAAAYRANLESYLSELTELDSAFEDVVEGATRRTLVFGDRFPFLYFARRYELTYYAAFPGCGRDTEPSAQTLAFLIEKVVADHIPVVYHIEQGNERVAQVIAGETGAMVRLLHSCHNISKADFEAGETYISLMRQNVEALRVGLS